MMLNLIQKDITSPILNETFTEYSLYTEVYINDIDFTLKCIHLHTNLNQSIEITEPNTGVAKTEFLEKYECSVGF
jgi:hypothetical protein